MSKISLKHSGGNVVSLNSPTSAPTSADVAFKLPNADGTSGQVLKTDGSGNLSFGEDTGGKILQVLQTVKKDTTSSANNGYVDISGLSQAITTTGSNKVLVRFHLHGGTEGGYAFNVRIARTTGGTTTNDLLIGDAGGGQDRMTMGGNSNHASWETFYMSSEFLDSPSAGTHTYKIQWSTGSPPGSNQTMYLNRAYRDNTTYDPRATSVITVMEVAA